MLLHNWLSGVVSMNYASNLFVNAYGDDDDVDETTDDDDDTTDDDSPVEDDDKSGKGGKETKPKGKSNQPPKTFTQEEVDKLITKRLSRERQASRQALEKLKDLESTAKMTAQERDELQRQIADMEKKILPADEIRKREARKAAEKYESDLKAAQSSAETWQSRYNDLKINHEIETAAALAGVKPNSTALVAAYLRPTTKVVPVLDDDDNETGNFVTQVTFGDHGEDGKPLTITGTIEEIVTRMRELPDRFGNLFEPNSKGGLGGKGGKGSGTPKEGYRQGMSMEEYMEARAKNPKAVYGQ